MNDQQRAAQAQQILNSELVQEALQVIEKMAVEKIASCDLADEKTLKSMTGILQSSRAFRSMFENWVALGQLEQEPEQAPNFWQKRVQLFKRQN